jgi:hypothetical protein
MIASSVFLYLSPRRNLFLLEKAARPSLLKQILSAVKPMLVGNSLQILYKELHTINSSVPSQLFVQRSSTIGSGCVPKHQKRKRRGPALTSYRIALQSTISCPPQGTESPEKLHQRRGGKSLESPRLRLVLCVTELALSSCLCGRVL